MTTNLLKMSNARLVGALTFGLMNLAAGQTVQFTPLTSIAYANGTSPTALALGNDGNFYGADSYSTGGNGSIFKATTNGTLTTLTNFNVSVSGGLPLAGLTLGTDGNFYGTTTTGGSISSAVGSVFRVKTNGTLTILTNFTGPNGNYPQAALTLGRDGNFYGTTTYGGPHGDGVVFQVTTNGALTALTNFSGTNGMYPEGGVTQGSDGSFYGTTFFGGAYGSGDVFKVATNRTLTVLTNFYGANGSYPQAGLTLAGDGSFYGVTTQGGAGGEGTVFRVTTNGALSILHSFAAEAPNQSGDYTNADGANPQANLTLGNDGNFYGAAPDGGLFGNGTLFQVTTNGKFATLYSFHPVVSNDSGLGTNTDGANPYVALTLGRDGSFYGLAENGGTNGDGTVFKLSLQGQPAIRLNLRITSGNAILTWSNSAFSLQSSLEAAGTYNTISNAASPYTNRATGSRKFFRLVGN